MRALLPFSDTEGGSEVRKLEDGSMLASAIPPMLFSPFSIG
jgi:hypothetical protein